MKLLNISWVTLHPDTSNSKTDHLRYNQIVAIVLLIIEYLLRQMVAAINKVLHGLLVPANVIQHVFHLSEVN